MMEYWIGASIQCHMWIENNKAQARLLGLLCPLGHYNVMPERNRIA